MRQQDLLNLRFASTRKNGVSLILKDDHKDSVMGRKRKPNESESHKRDVGVNMILTSI